ncbi:cytochrome c [Croceivirga thetidis]|uniref:Cytochrome c n=1 Tax=Croceivirga thetidis TaxID=2721623 RepID=A0ABX1GL62_9FLAO|nr:cytochrome c [Croceivirga thetidis]NKI30632.1 cytochrome c [Croceivirga thetidis]
MKTTLITIFGLLFLISCNEMPKEKDVPVLAKVEEIEKEEHGEYLVNILGCADCHTPKKMTALGPVPDMDKHLMGYNSSRPLPPVPDNVPLGPWVLFGAELTVAVGPWGTSFAGNLTPHETGLGNWNLEQFKRAMKQGKYKGLENSRPIMPPMPVEAYKNLTDEDVEAIFLYLKTIKPLENIVPAYKPPTS